MSLGHQWMQQFLRRPSLWEVRFESQFENLFDLFFSCRDYCLFCSKMHWQIFQSMGPCDCRAYAWLSIEDFEDIGLPGSEQSRTCYALFMILVHQRPYSSPLEVVCVCVFGICRRWFSWFISLLWSLHSQFGSGCHPSRWVLACAKQVKAMRRKHMFFWYLDWEFTRPVADAQHWPLAPSISKPGFG